MAKTGKRYTTYSCSYIRVLTCLSLDSGHTTARPPQTPPRPPLTLPRPAPPAPPTPTRAAPAARPCASPQRLPVRQTAPDHSSSSSPIGSSLSSPNSSCVMTIPSSTLYIPTRESVNISLDRRTHPPTPVSPSSPLPFPVCPDGYRCRENGPRRRRPRLMERCTAYLESSASHTTCSHSFLPPARSPSSERDIQAQGPV